MNINLLDKKKKSEGCSDNRQRVNETAIICLKNNGQLIMAGHKMKGERNEDKRKERQSGAY